MAPMRGVDGEEMPFDTYGGHRKLLSARVLTRQVTEWGCGICHMFLENGGAWKKHLRSVHSILYLKSDME